MLLKSIKTNSVKLSKAQENILKLLIENNRLTQNELKDILGINITTVARNISDLKNENIIKRVGSNKNGQWEVI